MPKYPWLAKKEVNPKYMPAKIRVLQSMGVPYPDGFDTLAVDDMKAQAEAIASGLQSQGIQVDANKEIIALIAYLQRLGTGLTEGKKHSFK